MPLTYSGVRIVAGRRYFLGERYCLKLNQLRQKIAATRGLIYL